MAVVQENKGKVQPVIDYHELNGFVKSHTRNSEVCPESIRRWRLMEDRVGILDLKNVYLQATVQWTPSNIVRKS